MQLFKYTKVEYAIDILEKERLYLSTPKSFNDPFDCFVSADDSEMEKASELASEFYSFKDSYDFYLRNKPVIFDEGVNKILERGKNLETTLKIYPFYTKWNEFNKYIKGPQSSYDNRIINKKIVMRRYLNDFQNTHLICCFSKRPDSILMWSHYADKHEGVCIEFDVDPTEKDIVDVIYKKDKVEFKIFKVISHILALEFLNMPYNASNQKFNLEVMEPLFTKSIDWQYEQEVRYILPARFNNRVFKDNNNSYIKSPVIKSVIIGCRADMNSDKIKRIIELANEKGVAVKYAQPDDHKFELNIK